MIEHDRTEGLVSTAARSARSATAAPPPAPAAMAAPVRLMHLMRDARPSAAQAISLQRTAGNRAAGRVLARWAPHPDKEKKGMLLSDGAVAEYNRFNVPLGK